MPRRSGPSHRKYAMKPIVGAPANVARAVEYVVNQPIELNIEELVIRPQKSMFG